MKLDGIALAEQILADLDHKTQDFLTTGVTPTLAVILVGDNPASLAYIKQKQKAADRIGAKVIVSHQLATIGKDELKTIVTDFNNNPNIHGLIIQRPLPTELGDVSDILNSVAPQKDVDGFLPNSPYVVPVATAVEEFLRQIYESSHDIAINTYLEWLRAKHIVIIGRGATAGKPIADYFKQLQCVISVIHSQTPNPKELMKQADIIISCVGKNRVATKDGVKSGTILISVGIWRDETGKLRGDYSEEEIADIASFYTPTPGGVGPVNVACLMQNLIKACMMSKGGS